METGDIIAIAKLYCAQKTVTYIRQILPSGYQFKHNGFILEVKSDMLIFLDIISHKTFPIPIDKITEIHNSRIGIEDNEALEILKEHLKKK